MLFGKKNYCKKNVALIIADHKEWQFLIERDARQSHRFPSHHLLHANGFVPVHVHIKHVDFALGCDGRQHCG